jgi:hypothetical protein
MTKAAQHQEVVAALKSDGLSNVEIHRKLNKGGHVVSLSVVDRIVRCFTKQREREGDPDTLMAHSLSSNTLNNATKFSHHSIQGHHHSIQGVERFADKGKLRWSMSVGCLLNPNSPAARYGSKAVFKRPVLGCGVLLGHRGSTLLVPDLHLPYQHRDAFSFLGALNDYYKFERVLCETDALNSEDEFELAMAHSRKLQGMFPHMVITIGNHDAIPVRQAQAVGLPLGMLSDFNKVYGLETTWQWVDQHWFDSWGAYPVVIPMVLGASDGWDGRILKV